ncbi:hypothetical protein M885DRAFT_624673 [Pelagophyceae sp. CCMP2097]|nr:hypothetical protein M885DRAFT_624673 [Pelagophyceae sp. CCMP2097]|mmetsp:Transcript_13358/g.46464  ORF Transcript_13358/g.46464 Transcript_13358/m.46464 type:complete len:330 (+) Transcript_13358:48-1037(+)
MPPSSRALLGDESRRQTIDLPRTHAALRVECMQRLGSAAPMKLWVRGLDEALPQTHADLRDGDVIIVERGAIDDTTHRAEYQPPPASARRPKSAVPAARVIARLVFYGESETSAAFKPRPQSARRRPVQQRAQGVFPDANASFQGRTTAQTDYTAPPPTHTKSAKPVSEIAELHKFEGSSEYSSKYVAHAAPRTPTARKPEAPKERTPFYGVTTSAAAFSAPPQKLSKPFGRPTGQTRGKAMPTLPFEGTSEYSSAYVPKEPSRRVSVDTVRVHIEPAAADQTPPRATAPTGRSSDQRPSSRGSGRRTFAPKPKGESFIEPRRHGPGSY